MNVPHNLVKIDINEIKPSLEEYIQNEADNGVRVLDVMFLAQGRVVALENGYTATATVSVNDVLITDNLSCTVDSANNLVKAEIDCKRLQLTGSGVMKVQITVSDGTNILISPQPVLIRLTSDLAQTAQIDDDSHGSYAEIVREVADARGDYVSLSEALAHKLSYVTNVELDNCIDGDTVYEVRTTDANGTTGRHTVICVPATYQRTQYLFAQEGGVQFRKAFYSNGTWGTWSTWSPIGTTSNIADGAVTEEKLESVVREKLNSIDSETVIAATGDYLDAHPELTTTVQDGAVTTNKLFNGAVTPKKLANGAVTTDKYADNSLIVKKLTKISRECCMANKVTPEMFGAVGDGKIDDSDAIQMAVDFAASHYSTTVYEQAPGVNYTPYDKSTAESGAIFISVGDELSKNNSAYSYPLRIHATRVEFAAKTYYISKPIVLRNPQDVYLYGNGGSGNGITVITRTSKTSGVTDNNPKSCFDFYGCRTGFISGISFRGSEYGIRFLDASYDSDYNRDATYDYEDKEYSSSDAARMICRVSNLVVDNCSFYNNTISGIDISTVVGYVYFRNCTITPGNNATGIRIGVNFSNPVYVNPNYIFMDKCNFMLDGTSRTGIAVYLCSHLTVTDCDFANGDTAVSLDYPDPYGGVPHANNTSALSFIHNKFFNNKYAFKYSDTGLGRNVRGIIIAENMVNLDENSQGFRLKAAQRAVICCGNYFISNTSNPSNSFHVVDFGSTNDLRHEFVGNVEGYINRLFDYCTFPSIMKKTMNSGLTHNNMVPYTLAANGTETVTTETVTLGDTHDWVQLVSAYSTNPAVTVKEVQTASDGTLSVTLENTTNSTQSGLVIGSAI